jgi:hypothetical protein
MSNYVKVADEAGDRYLAAMDKAQERFLSYVAATSALAPKSAPWLAVNYSAVREAVDAGFSFSEKLLDQQKTFSSRDDSEEGCRQSGEQGGNIVGKARTIPWQEDRKSFRKLMQPHKENDYRKTQAGGLKPPSTSIEHGAE